MRYYCECQRESINHVTPSVSMLDYRLQYDSDINKCAKTILDLGCGNGRNSLYLAKKYNLTDVVLVDSDTSMLSWAQELLSRERLPVKTLCASIEELAGNRSRFAEAVGTPSFDIIILSYVVQHIDPVYYPLIFDFCRNISKSYVAVDVFWNPARLGAGEFTKIGSVNWYGLTYEEVVTLIAPRFHILYDRIHRSDISVIINMLLTEGQSNLENVLQRNFEYYSNRIRRRRSPGARGLTRARKSLVNIHEIESVKLLSTLYPTEIDFVKTELIQWMQDYDKMITPSVMAAKFLWLCRMNKIPIMLNEVSRDFGIRTRNILQILSETSYVPPLRATDYVGRISKQLNLPDNITDDALYLVKKTSLDCTSPVMRACCAVIKSAEVAGFNLERREMASIVCVTTVGILKALERNT